MISWTSAAGCTILALGAVSGVVAVVAGTPAAVPAAAAAPAGAGSEPTGAGSCAARACHGSPRPVADLSILRNEHTTWIVRDRHAQAYQVLHEPRSADIVRKLGWPGPAHREGRCLACHATPTGALDGPRA